MPTIYDHHDKAFGQVAAYVVAKGETRVATIAFKFPRDGAARVYVYVHWIGTRMVRGYAGGFGYDKRSAAVGAAARALFDIDEPGAMNGFPDFAAFRDALAKDNGQDWERNLTAGGFEVWQAV